jgi:hypothetical protein
MVDIALGVARAGWPLIKPLLGFVAAGAVGFAAAETYEHKVPWGLSHKLAREIAGEPAKMAAARDKGIADQSASDQTAFGKWSAALDACWAEKAERNMSTDTQSRAAVFTSIQASTAYKLGRASCGVPNATQGSSPGGAAAGGLRSSPDDFSGIFAAGAFAPKGPAAVPGGSGGPRRP